MKKYIKPTIKTMTIDNEAPIAASQIGLYGDDNPITKDDDTYVESAKVNTISRYNPWGDE